MAMVTDVVAGVAAVLSRGVTAAGDPDAEVADRMPGLGAFIAFAFLAVALYFLLKNMNARLRRMSYREREREAAEEQALSEAALPSEADLPVEAALPAEEHRSKTWPAGEDTSLHEPGPRGPDRSESDRSESDRSESDRSESDRSESDRSESDRGESDRGESDRSESGRSESGRSESGRGRPEAGEQG